MENPTGKLTALEQALCRLEYSARTESDAAYGRPQHVGVLSEPNAFLILPPVLERCVFKNITPQKLPNGIIVFERPKSANVPEDRPCSFRWRTYIRCPNGSGAFIFDNKKRVKHDPKRFDRGWSEMMHLSANMKDAGQYNDS